MATVMITGGSGLVGTALSKMLVEHGYDVIILTRNPQKSAQRRNAPNGAERSFKSIGNTYYARWNFDSNIIDAEAIKTADYIVHLAGEGVANKRWTSKRKKEIVDSRVNSSQRIVKALSEIPNKVKAVISASAIGYYGPDNPHTEHPFIETDPPSKDFLGQTCFEWESAIQPVEEMGKRLVKFRTGIALSNEGGALREFKKPIRFGFATIFGKGSQLVSWIHIDDLCRLIIDAVENDELKGVYNAVSPRPVTNKELVIKLARNMRGSFFIPIHIPEWVLKTALGEMSVEILKSATVSSEKISSAGFQFIYPSIDAALAHLLKKYESHSGDLVVAG
jgi:uncharacterized protein (TIGR01777 family)